MIEPELHDCEGPERVYFSWWGLEDPWVTPLVQVTLDCPYAFKVTAEVGDASMEGPLIRFIEEVASLEGGWEGERAFSQDEQFVITYLGCYRGEIAILVSLDSDRYEPIWTVRLRLCVAAAEWAQMVGRLRCFFAAGRDARQH